MNKYDLYEELLLQSDNGTLEQFLEKYEQIYFNELQEIYEDFSYFEENGELEDLNEGIIVDRLKAWAKRGSQYKLNKLNDRSAANSAKTFDKINARAALDQYKKDKIKYKNAYKQAKQNYKELKKSRNMSEFDKVEKARRAVEKTKMLKKEGAKNNYLRNRVTREVDKDNKVKDINQLGHHAIVNTNATDKDGNPRTDITDTKTNTTTTINSNYELYKILDKNGYVPCEENLNIIRDLLLNDKLEINEENKLVFINKNELNEENEMGTRSDYKLYQILDNNGYKPTNENLNILKECLYWGTAIILSAENLSITEDASPEYIYMQLLENNDYDVCEENIKALKEAFENNEVLLEEGKAKKVLKTIGRATKGAVVAGLTGALGYHIANKAQDIAQTAVDNAATSAKDAVSTAEANHKEAQTDLETLKNDGPKDTNKDGKISQDETETYVKDKIEAEKKVESTKKEYENAKAASEKADAKSEAHRDNKKWINATTAVGAGALGAGASAIQDKIKDKKKEAADKKEEDYKETIRKLRKKTEDK